MIFEDKRQIGIFLIANIAAIYANGQNYNDRGNLHTGIAVEDDDEYLLNTEYYAWSDMNGVSQIWRWNVEEYPHPQLDYSYCNRLWPSNVCDPDQILKKEEVNELDAIIRKLFNETKCICKICDSDNGGIQIGIALLKNTFQPYIEHPSKVIRSFTENLRSKWNLGQCQDDILIVVATDDRQSYTDVGRTAAKYISKEKAYSVFNKSKTYFSEGDYYKGLLQMLHNYEELTKNLAKDKNDPEIGVALLSGIILVIVFLIGVIVIIAVLLYRRRNVKSKVTKTKHLERGAKTIDKAPSWRQGSIRTIFSTFKSTNDIYQPCKSQDEKSAKLPPYADDEEVLNLELALPDPVPHAEEAGAKSSQIHKQTSQDNQTQECQINLEYPHSSTNYDETDRLINGEKREQQNGVIVKNGGHVDMTQKEILETEGNNSEPFVTFTPRSQEKKLHQTDL